VTGRALLVCYGGAHAATIAPVVAALRARGSVEPVALALTTAAAAFRRRGIPFTGYRDYVEPTDDDALRLGEELLLTLGPSSTIAPEESVAYLGLSMAALVAEVGEVEARARYAKVGRHAFLQRSVLRRIVDRVGPSVVVATNSPKSERAAILAGNERGLPTLMVPDLIADPAWELYVPFEAQWFAAMNEAARQNLERIHGAHPERIVITGQPAFDKSGALDAGASRRYTREMSGWPGTRPYFVVATTWDQLDTGAGGGQPARSDHAHAVVALLRRVAAARHDVVVKPHPSEPAGTYEVSEHLYVAPPTAELDSLLAGAAGLVAAGGTTAVIDGLSFGMRTVLVQLDGKEPLLPTAQLGVTVVRGEPGLRAWLDGATTGTGPVTSELARNTGSAVRVAALVERLAADGRG
jgi:hypothetical protein